MPLSLPVRRILLLTLVVLLVVTACGKDKKEKAAAPSPARGPFAVGTRTLHFVDESRALQAADGPRRTLDTNIWYPAEGAASETEVPDAPAAEGPFPLIVFSHGRSGEPQQYAASFRMWARAGYVVAGVRHPLTVRGLPFPPVTEDIANQPADSSFVITRMGAEQSKLVDLDHVAIAGHSSGAINALASGFNTCCHDKRVDAVVLESVLLAPFSGGDYFEGVPATPVLFFHGDADTSFPYSGGRSVFEQVKAPKFFITIKGGSHSDPYRDGPPDYRLVAQASLDFFDRYLKDERAALGRLERDVASFPFGELEAVPE
jgi:predicted dienelactone hydrolase